MLSTALRIPARWRTLAGTAVAVPGTQAPDVCVLVPTALWRTFAALSLWVEALCIHEWCLFTAGVVQPDGQGADRGTIYRLFTDRPDNRRPLPWERNAIDVLLLEGQTFVCLWTGRRLGPGVPYAVDHLVPVALYPIHELWNLVPADPNFNSVTFNFRLHPVCFSVAPRLVFACTMSAFELHWLRFSVALAFGPLVWATGLLQSGGCASGGSESISKWTTFGAAPEHPPASVGQTRLPLSRRADAPCGRPGRRHPATARPPVQLTFHLRRQSGICANRSSSASDSAVSVSR